MLRLGFGASEYLNINYKTTPLRTPKYLIVARGRASRT